MGYQWEPVIQLGDNTSVLLDRPITGGIYKYDADVDVPTFADAGLSFGSFAPYIKTRRQLIESGDCNEETVKCGDILEITSPIGGQVSLVPTEDAEADSFDACAEALGKRVVWACLPRNR